MNTEPQRFRLHRTAATWFQDAIRQDGTFRTLGKLAVRIAEFVRDLTPERRRLRYGDLQFDFDYGTDTTWSNVTLKTRIREMFSGEPYQPIEAAQFHEMVGGLTIDYCDYTFIDIGSGKGRALLLASEYPFRRILGVEILPELHGIAKRNFEKYHSDTQQCSNLQSWCGDARDFAFPEEPTLLYLFNPLFEPVLRKVLANLKDSLRNHPRPFILMYVNPTLGKITDQVGFLNRVAGTHQYTVYTNAKNWPVKIS